MRVIPDSLNSERQLYQAGAELIGYNDATATAEILVMGVKALLSVGLKSITVDLGVPSLAEKLLCNLSADQSVLAKKSILDKDCLLYTSPSPRDLSTSRMPSSA